MRTVRYCMRIGVRIGLQSREEITGKGEWLSPN